MFPTGVQFNPGEQNIDMYKARQTRNIKDTVIILRALATDNPFSLDTGKHLRNIMNGVNIDSSVNANTSRSVREPQITHSNESAKAVTTALKSSVNIDIMTKYT